MGLSQLAELNPLFNFNLFEDWMAGTTAGKLGWVAAQSGAGAASSLNFSVIDEKQNLLLQHTTGTTATGRSGISLGTAGAWFLTNGRIVFKTAIHIPTLSTSAQRYSYRIGFGDSLTADHNEGSYFEYDEASSANWRCKTASGGVRTTTDSGVVVAAGSFIDFRIEVTDTTKVEFYINDVLVATHTTNLPIVGVQLISNIIKSVGTTARTVLNGFVYVSQQFTQAR